MPIGWRWKRWRIPREQPASEGRRSPAGRKGSRRGRPGVPPRFRHRVRPARAAGLPRRLGAREAEVAGGPLGGARRLPRRGTGRLELRGALGQLRRLRADQRAARLLGKRHRQAPARADDGAVRRLGHPSGGALHLPGEPEARGAVPEVRLLAADLDGGDVEAGGASARTRAVVVLYWQPCFAQAVRRADGGDLPGPGSSAARRFSFRREDLPRATSARAAKPEAA